MGIAFGLGAAVTWGCADYVAALAGRRIGSLPVVLGFHVLATLMLGALVLSTGSLSEVGASDLPFFALVALLGWGSYACFYRALAIGPISLLSPIVSGYAAVTVLLAVVFLGERLSGAETLAIVVSFAGVALASADVRQLFSLERADAHGLVFALAAMVLLGAFVLGVSARADELGWLAPVFLARFGSTILVALTTIRGGRWRFPDRSGRVVGALALLALLDTAGYVSFNLGVRHDDTAIVAAASAPYAVIPVVAGVALLRERPTPVQWAGVGLVIVGLVLLGLAAGQPG
jgi:drug/metabolite transporter (DMT)-like permease